LKASVGKEEKAREDEVRDNHVGRMQGDKVSSKNNRMASEF
jgi:hypothetical protein